MINTLYLIKEIVKIINVKYGTPWITEQNLKRICFSFETLLVVHEMFSFI